MMTLSWFEWSNNISHEKQEISILMIKKAWTRFKSSSQCFTLAVWRTFLESRNQNHPQNLPYKTEVKSTEGPYILGLQSHCMVNIEGYSGEMYLLGNPPGSWVLLLAASDHQKQPRKPLLRLFELIACCCKFFLPCQTRSSCEGLLQPIGTGTSSLISCSIVSKYKNVTSVHRIYRRSRTSKGSPGFISTWEQCS